MKKKLSDKDRELFTYAVVVALCFIFSAALIRYFW
jgi:hypothetical protein